LIEWPVLTKADMDYDEPLVSFGSESSGDIENQAGFGLINTQVRIHRDRA
jgi:hypothetical protein